MKNTYIFKKNNILIYQYNHCSAILKYNKAFLEQLQNETNVSLEHFENGEYNLEILCYNSRKIFKDNVFIDLRKNTTYPRYNIHNINIRKVINPSTFTPTVLISFMFK